MAEQSKEERIRDKICDAILKHLEPGSNFSPSYVKELAETYEILFGGYKVPTKPLSVQTPGNSDGDD